MSDAPGGPGLSPTWRNTLRYLLATQHAEGHWSQNQWLGDKPYWEGLQLDETAFPVLLAVALDERDALEGVEVRDMIRRALSYLARQGPVSQQGNARLESWTSVGEDAPLARLYGVPGYYVCVAPEQTLIAARPEGVLPIRNLPKDPSLPVGAQVGVDFLQLVRFGLRRADDPLIPATVKVVDALLKTDTPSGPVWHRYNEDGYGEHDDGSAYDGTGRGRGWPLLTGERGHYELCLGRDPLPFLIAMTRMASGGGMLPEQVWDAAPIPARGLEPGRPTGAAMPLVWAHAEFLKLAASRRLERPFDRPASVWERYRGERPPLTRVIWAEQAAVNELPEGVPLTIALRDPGAVRWGLDGWQEVREQDTVANPLGLHVLEIDTRRLRAGRRIDLTYRSGTRWVGRDFCVQVVPRTRKSN